MSLILSGTDGLSDVDGSAATPAIRGTDANTGIFFPAADTIAFAEGGAEAMRIDSSGNVGIGTASPAANLHVSSSGNTEVLSATTGANYTTFRLKNSTNDYSMQIRTDVSNAWVLRDETAGANRLVVDTSGNVTLAGTLTTAAQSIAKASLPTGSVLQVVNATYSTYSSSATTIPDDNTIPQNTEGTEIITLAITPTSATSKLLITSVVFATSGSAGSIICNALFQDTTANALAATSTTAGAGGWMITDVMQHYMTSGTTSSTTFKIRAGGHVGTTYFNGNTGAQLYNGTGFCSLTIMEIAA